MAGDATRAASATAIDRCAPAAWVKVRASVHKRLAQAGIDPAAVGALSFVPHPDPLRASGSRKPFDEFALLDGDGLAGIFAAKIGDIASRYDDGNEPDFANASLAELFAWCLGRPA